jgi:hypothetical protein
VSILGKGSLAEAARFYVENHINIVQKQVSDVVQELVNDRQKNGRSSSYLRDLRTRLGNFANSFKCPISSVTPENIEAYLDSTGATGHYRKNLRDAIGTLFDFARKRKYVQRDHPGVSPITKPSLVPHEVKIFAPEEFSKLLNAVPRRQRRGAALHRGPGSFPESGGCRETTNMAPGVSEFCATHPHPPSTWPAERSAPSF